MENQLVFGPTKKLPEILKAVVSFLLQYDTNLSKMSNNWTSITPRAIKYNDCTVGYFYSNRKSDFDYNVSWEVDGKKCYVSKELTTTSLNEFFEKLNKLYHDFIYKKKKKKKK